MAMPPNGTDLAAQLREFQDFRKFQEQRAAEAANPQPSPVPEQAQAQGQALDPNEIRFAPDQVFNPAREIPEGANRFDGGDDREWAAAEKRFGPGLRVARMMRATIGAQMTGRDSSPEAACRFLNDVMRDRSTTRHLEGILTRADATPQIPELGGFLVPAEKADTITEFLRPFLWLDKLGARVISSATGNLYWPYQKTGTTASYGNINDAITKQDTPTWGEASWQVKRLASLLVYPRELMASASFNVDQMFRDDAGQAMAQVMNTKALTGTGQNSEPLGLNNTTGLTAVTMSALPTEANMLEFEDKLMDAYINAANMIAPGFLLNNKALKALRKVNVTDEGLIYRKEIRDMKTIEGYPYVVTQLLTTGGGTGSPTTVYFGDWAEYIILRRGQLEVSASEHAAYEAGGSTKSTFQRNQVAIRFLDYHDMGPRRKEAFAKCANFYTVAP